MRNSARPGGRNDACKALRTAIVYEAGIGNRYYMANAVRVLVLAGLPGTFDVAATLAGAVAGPVLGVFPALLTPPQQDHYQQRLAQMAATPRHRPPH